MAGVVAVASYLTFDFFFPEPLHDLRIADSNTATALVISLVAAYVVGELARRAQERARDARLPLEGLSVAAQVYETGRRREGPFLPNTESRIADFTELVATAVSNAEARRDLVASQARLLAAGDEARRRVVRRSA